MYQDSILNLKEQNKDLSQEEKYLINFFVEKLELKWAEVETYRVKDKVKVQELMEAFVKRNG